MNDLVLCVRRSQQRLFTARDRLSWERARIVTRVWREQAAAAPAIRRARCLEAVLAEATIDLWNPVVAGNVSEAPRAWPVFPEFGWPHNAQALVEHDGLEAMQDPAQVPDDLRAFWEAQERPGGDTDVGHFAWDLEAVVGRGLLALAEDCERHPAGGAQRAAMAISLRAVCAWAARLALAAETAAERDPVSASCLRQVAHACRRVPAHPARDLHEGLQAIALCHLALAAEGHGVSVSIALPDRALARFAAEAAADPERAAWLVGGFLLAIAGNPTWGRTSKTQAITIGGATAQGGDACNAITRAFLDGFARVPVADPHLFLRWHRDLDPAIWSVAVAMLARGRSMPLLMNDHPTVAGLVACGVAAADAWDYGVIGCNEVGIPGRLWNSACAHGGTSFNHLAVLEQALAGPWRTLPELLDAWEARLAERLAPAMAARRAIWRRLAAIRPAPLASALMGGAAERGADLHLGMPYDLPGVFCRGLADAVNALAVLQAVADRGGDPCAHAAAVRAGGAAKPAGVAHWGEAEASTDRWAVELARRTTRTIATLATRLGLPPHPLCHVVRSLHHLDGRRIGPTPDGRAAGAPCGDSIGAVCGTTTQGPTAQCLSVLALDAAQDFAGAYNLNLCLPAHQATPPVLAPLLAGFLAQGGQEVQVNVLDATRLRQAMAEPADHGDLVVRIAGCSARFVELSRLEQDELVRRAEAAA